MDKWTMKKTIGLLLLGFSLVYVVVLWQSQHQKVSLEILLLNDPAFPDHWNTGYAGIEFNPITWQVRRTFFDSQPDTEFFAQSSTGRTWTDGGNDMITPRISQQVFQYANVFTTVRQYWLSRPEFAYYGKWPNLAPYGHKSDRYPSKWNYHSAYANQEHLVCAMGSVEHCQLWYYWARHGQYILSIVFFAPNQGIDTELFAQIVEQIDSHVGRQLSNE
jgi:hypothetical protein